jgi:cellulose synthase/poly-beta-1,6-N-acetylglucosamine synthase-like glycosyltransferase
VCGGTERGDDMKADRLLTIGIAAHNERENIGKLLENLLEHQDLPEKSQILVVTGGSIDGTPEIVKSYARRDSRIQLVDHSQREGKSSAINSILSKARGRILFFVPADVQPVPRTIRRMLQRFRGDVGIVAGRPIPVNVQRGLMTSIVRLIWSLHQRTLHVLNDTGMLNHASGEMFAIRTGIIDKIPSVVNDDAYIAMTTKRKGYSIKYDPKAEVMIKGPETLKDYIIQRRRVVYGHYELKKTTGEFPGVLEFIPVSQRSSAIRIIAEELRENPRNILVLMAASVIEGVVHFVAALDTLTGKSHLVWETAHSTKKRST